MYLKKYIRKNKNKQNQKKKAIPKEANKQTK